MAGALGGSRLLTYRPQDPRCKRSYGREEGQFPSLSAWKVFSLEGTRWRRERPAVEGGGCGGGRIRYRVWRRHERPYSPARPPPICGVPTPGARVGSPPDARVQVCPDMFPSGPRGPGQAPDRPSLRAPGSKSPERPPCAGRCCCCREGPGPRRAGC